MGLACLMLICLCASTGCGGSGGSGVFPGTQSPANNQLAAGPNASVQPNPDQHHGRPWNSPTPSPSVAPSTGPTSTPIATSTPPSVISESGTVRTVNPYGTLPFDLMVQISPGVPYGAINCYAANSGNFRVGDLVNCVGQYTKNVFNNQWIIASSLTLQAGPQPTASPPITTPTPAPPPPPTSAPTATPTPSPVPTTTVTSPPATATPAGVAPANHVLTMALVHAWNGGQNVSASQAAPYLSWASNVSNYVSTLSASGIKAYAYTDGTTEASCSGCSYLWNTLQANPQYISRNCSNATNNVYGDTGQEWVDVTKTGWYPYWVGEVEHAYSTEGSTLAAVFSDNNGAPPTSALPCGVTQSQYVAAVGKMLASTSRPVIFNGLAFGADEQALLDIPNVIGGMTEGCYSGSWTWTTDENAQLAAVAKNKLSICYDTRGTSGASSTGSRLFDYASFLLVFNLPTTMLFESFAPATSGGLSVYPETGLVPTNPLVATPGTIAALSTGGAYAREYAHCFYRGTDEGACAAVVNPSGTSVAFPYVGKYSRTLVLSGSDVLDGGSASFNGSAPGTLAPYSGVIAFK